MSFGKLITKSNIYTCALLILICLISSCLNTKTTILEKMNLDLTNKLSTFSQISGYGEISKILSKMIELSQSDTEGNTKTFIMMIQKVRNLVDGMLDEQKTSDTVFKKTSTILIKYIARDTAVAENLLDKRTLLDYYSELLESIQKSSGSVSIKANYTDLESNLGGYLNILRKYQYNFENFKSNITNYYDTTQSTLENTMAALQNYNNTYKKDEVMDVFKFVKDINDVQIHKALEIKSRLIFNLDNSDSLNLLENYLNVIQNLKAGEIPRIVREKVFNNLDEEIKKVQGEIISLTTLFVGVSDNIKIAKDSLKSNYEEYVKNTKSRSDITKTILDIIDFMSARVKKVSVSFMVYLESVADKFPEYKNSYEFNQYKNFVFEDVTFNKLGQHLVANHFKTRENKRKNETNII